MIWKIAWGSVVRHGRRSLLIILVVAISVAAMLFVSGMMDGMREDFFENMISSGGHLRLDHADSADALDPFSLELLVDDWRQHRDWFARQPEVLRVEPTLSFGALVLVDGTSVPMAGYGVLPDTGFFSDVRGGMEEGGFLSSGEGTEILLSRSTADMLGVQTGDTVSVLVEDSTGAPYYLAYQVRGLFSSDSGEFDESSFLIPHSAAQDLLYLGDQTRELRVVLNDEAAAEDVAARFAGTAELRVQTWREINGGVVVLLELFDVFVYAINLLIVIVAATVITNAILMNVFEKIGEYGMMRAIGLTRKGQFGLVIAEGAGYGVIGSLVGLAIGIPLVLWFSRHGINFGEMMESFGMAQEVTFHLDPLTPLMTALFDAAVAVVGRLYAGWTAMRLSVIESLRGTA